MAQWTVWLDGAVMHQPVTNERNATAARLELALDGAGLMEIEIPTSHPEYARAASLPILGRPVWRVERDGAEVFRGRTLARTRAPLDGAVRVTVEGELAMLNDTLAAPYEYAGSPAGYLSMMLEGHNAQADPWKRFSLGRVSVPGSIVRGSESFATTWEELAAKTFESSAGGHIVLRRGTRTIDWLADASEPCGQPVRLGWNLLRIEDEADGAELATAIRAQGADVDGARVELAPERTGAPGVTRRGDLLVSDALAQDHGTVARVVTWDDVTLEPNLWSRAVEYVQGLAMPRSVTVSAIDMSDAGHAVDAFDVGQVVTLDALDTQGTMQVTGIEWDLLDPAGGSITFGAARVTSSARAAEAASVADAALYVAGGRARPGTGGRSSATYAGAGTTETASTANWKVAKMNALVASAGTPGEAFTFSDGVITAVRPCVLSVTGVMSWRDNVTGQRGFGVCEGGTITGGTMTGTEHSVFNGYNLTSGNYYRAVTFPPRLFGLAAGDVLTLGHWEPTNGVYYNGGGHTWATIEVVE